MLKDYFLLKTVLPLAALTFSGVYTLSAPRYTAPVEEPKAVERSVFYSGCNEVRAAGKAPLYRGDPGYREGMDGDNDGIACEPYHRY
ncbi:MAG: excalibur calcium-binding domain-containing protein [Parasphingorhabdus sp.]|uniref:excalibur calcium-binding domain-containing protein n=1 Tax=Parasphingorhabdus sp. TaxID=2709688 RepID=UPI003001A0BB